MVTITNGDDIHTAFLSSSHGDHQSHGNATSNSPEGYDNHIAFLPSSCGDHIFIPDKVLQVGQVNLLLSCLDK